MSTRSAIGMLRDDGSVYGIYCHFDGYLSGVGKNLFDNYNSTTKVMQLLLAGNVSVLKENIDECKVYNEPMETFPNIDEFVEAFEGVDYFYIFEDGKTNPWSYKNIKAKQFSTIDSQSFSK